MTTRPAHDAGVDLSPPPEGSVSANRSDALPARVERESGMTTGHASPCMWMRAAAHASRAQLAKRMNRSLREDRRSEAKRVHYLSMEFLMGRALGNALAALGLHDDFEAAARAASKQPGDILEVELDAALGNGRLLPRFSGHAWCAVARLRIALPLRRPAAFSLFLPFDRAG